MATFSPRRSFPVLCFELALQSRHSATVNGLWEGTNLFSVTLALLCGLAELKVSWLACRSGSPHLRARQFGTWRILFCRSVCERVEKEVCACGLRKRVRWPSQQADKGDKEGSILLSWEIPKSFKVRPVRILQFHYSFTNSEKAARPVCTNCWTGLFLKCQHQRFTLVIQIIR